MRKGYYEVRKGDSAAVKGVAIVMMRFFNRKRSSLYGDALIVVIAGIFIERVLLNYVVPADFMIFLRSSLVWEKLSMTLALLPVFFAGAWLAKYDICERALDSLFLLFSEVHLRSEICCADFSFDFRDVFDFGVGCRFLRKLYYEKME